MNKLSILSLTLMATSLCAMKSPLADGGEEYAPPVYQPQELYQPQQDPLYGMAGAQPAAAAPQAAAAGMPEAAVYLTALYNNNEQLLAALTAQQNICLNNRQNLAALIAMNKVDGAAVLCGANAQQNNVPQNNANAQQNNNMLRAQQVLAQLERADAPKRINLIISNAQQQLREKLRTSVEKDYGMGRTRIVQLAGKELEDAVEAYVGRMSTIESSLMNLLQDPYLSEAQSEQAIKFLTQARQQAQDAKNAGLKQPSRWAGVFE